MTQPVHARVATEGRPYQAGPLPPLACMRHRVVNKLGREFGEFLYQAAVPTGEHNSQG